MMLAVSRGSAPSWCRSPWTTIWYERNCAPGTAAAATGCGPATWLEPTAGAARFREQLGVELEPLGMEGRHLATLFEADLAPSVNHRLCVLHVVMKPKVEGIFVPSRRRPVGLRHGIGVRRAGGGCLVDAGAPR